MIIREIEEKDNEQVEQLIRITLTEFGANRDGFAWSDPELSQLYNAYIEYNCNYWVIEDNGEILGGCGIAPMKNLDGICELQKMYLYKSLRKTGMGTKLLEVALDFAKIHYKKCYLETLKSMEDANRFYKKHRFKKLDKPIILTEHFACDTWYIKELK